MRWSRTYIRTLRQDPADAEVVSHRLMARAGLISKLAAGIYNYLPLGWRSIRIRVFLRVMRLRRAHLPRSPHRRLRANRGRPRR